VTLKSHLAEAAQLLTLSASDSLELKMARAVDAIVASLSANKALLVCGNGGSASDALHIAGELVAQFMKKRRALKAICLGDNMAALTAWANDYSYESAYARQVEAFGEPGGVLLALSTSGNSKNVVNAIQYAKKHNAFTIGFTGFDGGILGTLVDINLHINSDIIEHVEDLHLVLEHMIIKSLKERVQSESMTPLLLDDVQTPQ